MLLTVRDDKCRYRIECPDACKVRIGHGGHDYLLVPDPARPDEPFWLFDDILIEAARSGDFGLKLLTEQPLAAAQQKRVGED
jgi:hypothetical protein